MGRKKVLDKSTINKKTEKRKGSKNYLNNADLLIELKKSKEQDKMTDNLAKMFMLLAAKYASKGRFVNYTYNDDLQSFALLTGVRVWRSFDPTKSSNPFAYFTQVFKSAFLQYDNNERRQRDIRDAKLIEAGANPSYSYTDRYNEDFEHHLFNDLGFTEETQDQETTEQDDENETPTY
jgi:hypothetical protein